jgi:putative ABC transport system permease protein
MQDVRHAVRMMATQRGFTAAALLTLALGIGATTAIFSMVYGVLLRPLPYPEPERLMRVSEEHPGGAAIVRYPMLSNVTYLAWRDTSRTMEDIAAYASAEFTLREESDAARVSGASVSPALFTLVRARARLGRVLNDQDAVRGAPEAVVLSDGLWRERFAGDPNGIGRDIILDGRRYTVVGVMPADFYFPTRSARLWTTYRIPRPEENPGRPFWGFWAVGRLRPGITPAQAAAEGTGAARSVGQRPMAADLILGKGGPVVVRVEPLLSEMTSRVRPALVMLLVSVGLVFLIACVNVTNLLLSRGVARQRELAIRAAIGAGQGRLVRQLFTEALVLSLAGGALGIAIGWLLMRAIPALAPEDFPRLADIQLDRVAVACAVVASLVSGLAAGALPAARIGRDGVLAALRDGAGASRSTQARRLGTGLLVAEAAVAVMLLVGAALLGRSFVRLLHVDPGYDATHVLMARVYLPPPQAASEVEERFARDVLQRIRALPGVTAAGMSNMAPFVPASAVMSITLNGGGEPLTARTLSYVITPGYAEALSLRVREGRLFTEADVSAGIRPTIINKEFARTHLNDGKPMAGRRFSHTMSGTTTMVEIVGVVDNVLKDGLNATPQAEMYNVPREAFGLPPAMNLAVRTSSDPLALIAPVRAAIRSIEAAAAVDDIETLGSRMSASVSEPRFAMAVLIAFAVLASLLAAVGLYGVLSYQVLQRRREMGVRAALGASRASLLALVLRQGVMVAGAGIVVGLIGAAGLTRLMQGLLFGVTAHDVVAFAVAPVMLLFVAVAATLIPARRAAAADPIEVLRAE